MGRLFKYAILTAAVFGAMSACSHTPPEGSEVANACDIFDDRKSWYRDMKRAEKRWGMPVHVQLAIMRQESSFDRNARPPRSKILWVLPGPRKSSAYGFAQAQSSTWKWYQSKSGRSGADRNDFGDAADFISWYGRQTLEQNGLSPWNAYGQYLAYHEGHGGFNRGTYKNKPWLMKVARKVEHNAGTYQTQLKNCEGRLNRGFGIF